MTRPLVLGAALLLGLGALEPGPGRADDASRPAPLEAPGAGRQRPRATALRTRAPLEVDGRLDEADWGRAQVIDDFRTTEPVEGAPLSERTELRVLYDEHQIYFGIRCFDRSPEELTATVMRRDASQRTDDRILVVIDTFHDRRTGYAFGVTPTAARWDVLLEDGGGFNPQWDGIWYAATTRDAGGWTVEMAIPFNTLNFNPGGAVWGLNFGRGIPRSNEFARWAAVDQDVFFFDVAHFGDLEGLAGLEQGIGLDVVPALVVRHDRDNARSRTTEHVDPAVDAFYKITPSLTGVLTANTDFSDAPPDDREINLTRFSLFFPERRDFFLQDSGIFRFADFGLETANKPSQVNGQPFFSRRIGIDEQGPLDLRIGGKLTGRVGPVNLGLLSTRVESHDAVDGKWLSVARASVNLFEESMAGVIATYGNPSQNEHNKLLGADFNYRTSHAFDDQILEGTLWVQKTSSPESDDRDAAFGAALTFPNDRWNWRLRAIEIQENFEPTLGFVNRRAIRSYTGRLRRRWRPGGELRRVDVGVDGELVTGTDNDLQTLVLGVDLPEIATDFGDFMLLRAFARREELLEDFEILEGVVIPRDNYRFERVRLELQSSRNRPLEVGLTLEHGGFFSGTRFDLIGRLSYHPSPHLLLGLEYEQAAVRLPEGDFTTRIVRANADFAFSPSLSWTNLVQWDNLTEDVTVNSRLRWIVQPGRELVLVFDPFFTRDDRLELTATTTAAVVKVFWTLRF